MNRFGCCTTWVDTAGKTGWQYLILRHGKPEEPTALSKEENKLYTARQRWREEQLKKQKSNAEKETEDQWKSMLRTRSSVSRIFQFF